MTKEWREEVVAMITLLEERFPACFAVFERRRRPLKVGIDQDILAAVAVDPVELGWALRRYVRSDGYLEKFRPGAARIDLDGNPAGVVTDVEANGARVILAKRAERRAKELAEREAAEEEAKQESARTSIEKLREAAALRRERAA